MGYRAFVADEQHRDAITTLWRESLSDERIAAVIDERFEWLSHRNPAGAAKTWVVTSQDGADIIGCASALPRMVSVGGRLLKGGLLADFAVAKANRIAGPAVALQRTIARESLAAGYDFIYGYPNEHAVPIFKRLRFPQLGQMSMWVKPLRAAYKLNHYVGPELARVAGVFADQLLAVNDLRLALTRPLGKAGELAKRADQRFDQLWQHGRSWQKVAPERTTAFLNWRYAEHPTERYRFFCFSERRSGRLRGYVVYRTGENKVFLVDAFWDGNVQMAQALLLRFSVRMRREGYDSICVTHVGDETFLTALKTLLFFRRAASRTLIAYVDKSQPASLRQQILDGSGWSMFDGEMDI